MLHRSQQVVQIVQHRVCVLTKYIDAPSVGRSL
jgi:hypothetical protein